MSNREISKEEILERVEKLENENQKLKEKIDNETPKKFKKKFIENENISRRNFLKMSALGIGTLGMTTLGASQWINLTQEVESGGIPTGVITMWSGSTSDIPSGWTLCDGNDENGKTVPDLRNRFIIGAGDQYSVGNTGGEKQVTLTVEEMPSHSHSNTYYNEYASGGQPARGKNSYGGTSASTDATGGDQAHENRPPYYALAYIMKL